MEKEGTLWGRGAARAGYSSKVNAREAAQDGQREDGEEGEGAHAGAWEGLGVKGFSGALRSGSGPQGVAAEAIEAAAEATSGSEVEEREEFMLDRKEVRWPLAEGQAFWPCSRMLPGVQGAIVVCIENWQFDGFVAYSVRKCQGPCQRSRRSDVSWRHLRQQRRFQHVRSDGGDAVSLPQNSWQPLRRTSSIGPLMYRQ